MNHSPKNIISNYYQAWIQNNKDLAESYLYKSLHFKSPNDEFHSAQEFLNACWQYSNTFTEFNIVQEVYSENDAYIVYKMGEMHIGELIKTKNNKITEIYVTFNPTV